VVSDIFCLRFFVDLLELDGVSPPVCGVWGGPVEPAGAVDVFALEPAVAPVAAGAVDVFAVEPAVSVDVFAFGF
jgi:hypothetical protein